MPKPAVFLDRDGTLIEDVGILKNPDDIDLYPDTIAALKKLQQQYSLFVVTNQSGVAHGNITMGDVENVNGRLDSILKENGVFIKKWYVCPHDRNDNCQCIKPKPFFLLKASKEFNLSLTRSFFIGDHPHDSLTGEDFGVFGLYVLTGHGKRHLEDLPLGKLTFHTLGEAASWIVDHPDPVNNLHTKILSGAEAVREGRLVAFPTETVYGLGADALNQTAVSKIFKAKNRPLEDPLIVHISDIKQVKPLVTEVSQKAISLMKYFWPGPLTLVIPKSTLIPDIVTAGIPSVALRMPSNPLALKLIKHAGVPVAAPSANLFGYTSPTTAEHVAAQLDGEYDVLIDGGACRVGLESTVLSLVNDTPVLLRPGGISVKDIESVIGPVDTLKGNNSGNPESPGLMTSHYATNTLFYVYPEIPGHFEKTPDAGIILLEPSKINFEGPVEILSKNGNLREASVNLYAAMRRLDSLNLKLIATHLFPDSEMGIAINNRILKAAGGKISEIPV